MGMAERKWKRRNLFSNPRVQVPIVAVFAIVAGLYVATNYFVCYRLLKTVSSDIMSLSLTPSVRTDIHLILEQHGAELSLQLTLLSISGVIALLLGGLLLSHHLGGPIYRLHTYLKGVTSGNVPKQPIRFRRHDFFQDLANDFNAFQRSQSILPPEELPATGTDCPTGCSGTGNTSPNNRGT